MSKKRVEAKSLFDYIDNLQQAKDKLQNDYQNVVDIINELQQENQQLKEDKKKVIEYINKRMIHEGEYYFRKAKHFRNTEFGKDLLLLLGDEKNE